MNLIAAAARAYVYAGDWVADCPRGCGGVEHLFDRTNPRDPNSPRLRQKTEFHCSYCQMTAPIIWAPDMAAITAVLMLRPVPHTRNWYPKDHDVALRFRIPHGQTVDELREENREHGVPAEAVH
jgi:hypothetical protein